MLEFSDSLEAKELMNDLGRNVCYNQDSQQYN